MDLKDRTDLLFAVIYPPTYKKALKFSGYVRSFSSFNERGPFDILPAHENFVCAITGSIDLVDHQGEKIQFKVDRAVVEASGNLVKVFVEY